VIGNSGSTGWGGEEVREELGFWGKREREDREDGSGWGGRGNDGNRGFSDGWQEVLYWDVGKRDLLDDFFELQVDIGILVLRGQGILKLGAYNVSLLGSDVGEDVEKVGQGDDRGWG
jgi:hypothetical protein